MGIEDSRADRLQGWFYEGGRDLRRLEMTGSVSVFRKTADRKKKPLEQKLSSEVLSLDFLPGQQLQEAIANRRVVVNLEEAQEKRSLAAQESLRVWYRDGLVDRMEGVGGCVVQGVSEDGDSRAEAPVFRAWYEEGKLKRLNAEGGVVVHTEEKAVKRTTTSRQMEASYQAGKLSELLHTGDLRFREEGPTSQLDLTGDQARYSAQDERVTVSGKATPVLRYRGQAKGKSEWQTSETRAATFVLNRRDKHIVAEGAVRSVLQEKDGLIVVNAQKMEADQGGSWVTYTGDPKVTQNANSIAGQSVRYNNDDQQLVVDGQVVSVLVGEGRSVLRKYRVLSSHLVYDRKKGNALYEGEVEVTSQDFRLLAPFVQLEFETDQTRQMRQVAAWGGVQVWQLERKAQGKRAIYDPKSERVELFSN
jgi:lipopolysaccharide export system protein LptA